MVQKEACAAQGRLAAGRDIMFEIYRFLATFLASDKLYSIQEIGQAAWWGEKNKAAFLNCRKWQALEAKCPCGSRRSPFNVACWRRTNSRPT